MTLTSMAGIQLVDAETDYNSNASTMQIENMSGAMPTATVEEINVPVFIDEYLQDSVDSATQSAFFKDLPNDNNVDGSAKLNGTDQEDYDQETLKDIENYLDKMMANANEINNSSNSNSNNNNCHEDFMHGDDQLTTNCMMAQDDEMMMNLSFSDEESFGDFANIEVAEDAVDINAYGNSSLEDCLTFSQERTPLLSETISQNSNSQVITNAVPILSSYDMNDECLKYANSFNNSNSIVCGFDDFTERFFESAEEIIVQKSNPKPHLPALNINLANSNQESNADVSTAAIIDDIIKSQEFDQETRSPSEIIAYLQGEDNNIIKVEYDNCDENSNNTHATTSNSYFDFTLLSPVATTATLPNSPAPSTTSTIVAANSNSAKRKRGRPAKSHSDIPDVTQLQNMSPEERKRTEDRAKNNEASRQSRLKKSRQLENDRHVETELETRNKRLKRELDKLERIALLLKAEVSAVVNAQ